MQNEALTCEVSSARPMMRKQPCNTSPAVKEGDRQSTSGYSHKQRCFFQFLQQNDTSVSDAPTSSPNVPMANAPKIGGYVSPVNFNNSKIKFNNLKQTNIKNKSLNSQRLPGTNAFNNATVKSGVDVFAAVTNKSQLNSKISSSKLKIFENKIKSKQHTRHLINLRRDQTRPRHCSYQTRPTPLDNCLCLETPPRTKSTLYEKNEQFAETSLPALRHPTTRQTAPMQPVQPLSVCHAPHWQRSICTN